VQATTIKEALVWRDIVQPELASLDLINARAGALVDDIQSWPASGKLGLRALFSTDLLASEHPDLQEIELIGFADKRSLRGNRTVKLQ